MAEAVEATTGILLARWSGGDRAARDALLERHLPWLRRQVSARLGSFLRTRGETGDYLAEVVGEFLEYAPRIAVADESRFRAMLLRIVETTLRDESDWYRAKRRDLARSVPLSSDSVLDLDPALHVDETPSGIAARAEEAAWVRLGLELLEAEARRLIVAHDIEGRSFTAIARDLGLSDDAVERRHRKAFARLAIEVKALRRGELASPPAGSA